MRTPSDEHYKSNLKYLLDVIKTQWHEKEKPEPDLSSQPPVLGWPEAASHSLSTCRTFVRASCQHFSTGDR